jgi:F-type H+-transporting ATPase subunit delta
MPEGSLARRYAKAFIEITTRVGVVDPVGKDLLQLAEIVEASRELRIALENPAIDRASRKAVLAEILRRQGGNPETRRLVEALIDRDRLGVLREIAHAYRALADETAGRVRAAVVSAERLDEARLGQIQRALERVTGKRVVIEHDEDPALLAGVVTRIGSWVYDGSLRSQMTQLRDTLLEE